MADDDGAEKPSAPAETRRETGAPEPINLVRFCELLQVGSALRAKPLERARFAMRAMPCADDSLCAACAHRSALRCSARANARRSCARGLLGRSTRHSGISCAYMRTLSQNLMRSPAFGAQEHAEGSVQCANSNCAMLFGSTGAGKSTLLHLLAGAKFSREAVEVGGDDDEFGADIDMQLVTDMKIPGCVIGQSRSSTTRLLNSHFDSSTNLMYVDTPGFNNVGDEGDDDTTIDAANSGASCCEYADLESGV